MRIAILAASLAASCQAAALPEPQFGTLASGLKLAKTLPGKAVYRQNAQRATLRYSSINLAGKNQKKPFGAGMSMDPKGQGGIISISEGICTDCTILSGHFKLSDSTGKEVGPKDGVYIHHLVSFDTAKKGFNPIGNCGGAAPSLPIGAAFVDRGEDSGEMETIFTSQDGKFDSGYHVGKKAQFMIQYDFVNYKENAIELFVDFEYEYLPGKVGKDAGHTLKSVTGCGGNGLSPKLNANGPAITESGKMPISEDTSIIWARGHLHAGGSKMTLAVNGKDICESNATYDTEGVITKMSLCPEVINLKKGDYITIRSLYDLSKHELRASTDGHGHAKGSFGGSDVMGMFAMTFATSS